jgi:sulfite exporter TauE/SafE
MTAVFITAFLLGAVGSTHCIAMCGPIALSLPGLQGGTHITFLSTFLYNIGRIITYSFIGLLLGLLGTSFNWAGFQKALSVGAGVLLLIFLFFPYISNRIEKGQWFHSLYSAIRGSIIKMFNRKDYWGVFTIGLLNGLLPCGLVYVALAGAIGTQSIPESIGFMMFFGLGTLPLMWTFSFFGKTLASNLRGVFKYSYPLIVFIMAILLILRGLSAQTFTGVKPIEWLHHKVLIECYP